MSNAVSVATKNGADSAEAQRDWSNIKSVLREISRKRLKDQTLRSDIEIEDYNEQGQGTFDYWMAVILVAGAPFKVTFKVHYKSRDVLGLGGQILNTEGKDPAQIEHMITDFMKEYCNMTAGGYKSAFEAQELSVGMSLPMNTRGFDEVFSALPSKHLEHNVDTWKLVAGSNQLICNSTLVLNEPEVWDKLNATVAEQPQSNDDDMEFL